MKLCKISLGAAVLTGLAFAAPQLAWAQSYSSPDMSAIGIDVSAAGSTYQSVQNYLSSLGPDARQATLSACQTANNWPNQYSVEVQNFCRLAVQ